MPTTADSPQLNILHVLTLNGRNGEYGGPVRVARELCQELNSRGHKTHIFSGALLGSEPSPQLGLSESYVLVKPLFRKLAVSSLWSRKLILTLRSEIIKADIVHIHFARDLLPYLAAFLSVIYRKPFVTQTHGMVIPKDTSMTIAIDSILTKPLLNKSKTNFVLTNLELSSVNRLGLKVRNEILPNGIANISIKKNPSSSNRRIVFCSRLDKRKGIDKFIDLADAFKNSGLRFEIYGPNGGELDFVRNEINRRGLSKTTEYMGSLFSDDVIKMLVNIDLLVLPSKEEPFPMVILEAISVGTPVLVMPSCGIATTLATFDPSFVGKSEDFKGLKEAFDLIFRRGFRFDRAKLIAFTEQHFGIQAVTEKLMEFYYASIN